MYDVLLLDDERAIRSLLCQVLGRAGWTVGQADGTEQAGTVLRTDGARVLVADKRLGGDEDGHRFARAAKALRPDLAVIFTSSDSQALSMLDLGDGEWAVPKTVLPNVLDTLVAAATAGCVRRVESR